MLKKFIDKRFKAKLRYLTYRLHKKILYSALALFGIATIYLAATIGGLPATSDVLNAISRRDLITAILFAAAMSITAFALGKMYVFQEKKLIIKGFLITHTLDMSGIESLERAERWGFTWFRLHCAGRTFLVLPPDEPEEFARSVEKGMEGEEFEGSFTKYGPSWFI